MNKKWNENEKEIMKNNYFDMPMKDLIKLLPGRTKNAILSHGKVMKLIRSFNLREKTQFKPTHGMSDKKIKAYSIWCGIRQRCNATYHKSYERYGGRGIKRCKEWDDFEVFYKDMGDPPENMTLGRIDNNKGYSKENCKWESLIEQANNRSSSRFIEAYGKKLTIKQWSRETGIKRSTIEKRIDKYGWSSIDAISKPTRKTSKYIHHLSGKLINE